MGMQGARIIEFVLHDTIKDFYIEIYSQMQTNFLLPMLKIDLEKYS